MRVDDVRVRLLNHASLSVDAGDGVLLTDPWLVDVAQAGGWRLVTPTPVHTIPWERVRWVWISRAADDRLHRPTLDLVRRRTRDATVLYPTGAPGVRPVAQAYGLAAREVAPGSWVTLEPRLSVRVEEGGDGAVLVRAGSTVLLHQNDALPTREAVQALREAVPRIDLWTCRFSFTGFHANPWEGAELFRARSWHLDTLRRYREAFSPRWALPIGAFHAFCRSHGAWMNRWRISPREAVEALEGPAQVLWPGQYVRDEAAQRHADNLARWDAVLAEPVEVAAERQVGDEEILAAARGLLARVADASPRLVRPTSTCLALRGEQRALHLDLRHEKAELVDASGHSGIAAALHAEDLVAWLSRPDGPDVVDAAATAVVLDRPSWWHLGRFVVAAQALDGAPTTTRMRALARAQARRVLLGRVRRWTLEETDPAAASAAFRR